MTANMAAMRILSRQERWQATQLPEERPRGLLARLLLPQPEPSAAERAARYAALTARRALAESEDYFGFLFDRFGREPFDLAEVRQFLRRSAILDEAEAYRRLFPEEHTAWMPQEALARFLLAVPKTTEGRILLQRLTQEKSAFLTIELGRRNGGGEPHAAREPWLLTMIFCTDNLTACFA